MQVTEIMLRYGELSTKGKNKKYFIKKLLNNVKNKLKPFKQLEVKSNRDRMYITLNGEEADLVMEELKDVFGIQSFSPVVKVEKSLEEAKKAVVSLIGRHYEKGMSFKINTRRSDHEFEYDTNDLNRLLGKTVAEAYEDSVVQMKNPDITARVEIRHNGIYISVDTILGLGGLPVGTAGKGMLMLSGGIDSPVAGYLALKRGMTIEAVHFHSPPYTSPQALQKAKDLTSKLARYAGPIQFIEVPFTEIQEAIKKEIPDSYSMTVTRRMMLRLTDEIRKRRDSLAIANGESLGQVASQTLESMLAINEVTSTPILRPLISMDKNEIIDIAKQIDTFELAVQPFEDCCTVFAPVKPKTKPKLDKVKELEKALDIEQLVQNALDGLKIDHITTHDNTSDQQDNLFESLL
ncbi:tRNA 4-thiouridine(8) synthase ThiI [Alkalibacterium iburiense]|uniref:Probable tRNA sulfurtransferase n=1 Tax=Alkalibacterium iburiense TaxID=290589 RepID=A0ABP3HII3_9LACT